LLGVYISFNLSWNTHVEFIRAKSAKLLGFVNRNLKGCSPNVLSQVYLALIRPIIMHGTPSWHPTTISNVVKLQRIQNRASRCIFGKKFSHELDKKILSVDSILKFTDILYFYQCFNNIIYCSVTNTVRGGRSIRDDNDTHRLVPPFARTSMYQNSFVYRCCSMEQPSI
jgi:hypothetical protein